ncbi:MAG TPA: glycosyltransferase family 2 protein, partial [Blastocatellia bacterium]
RPMPGAIPSAIAIRRQALARVGEFATQWKVGEFADWYARAVEAGLRLMMLPAIVARRRLHLDNQGVRHQREVSAYAQILKQSLDRRRAQSEQG